MMSENIIRAWEGDLCSTIDAVALSDFFDGEEGVKYNGWKERFEKLINNLGGMKKYYQELMNENADSLSHKIVNSKGQTIEFYECPKGGDLSPVIAVCHELKVASDTDFFDTEDFYEDSDYNPVFLEDEMKCEYEL